MSELYYAEMEAARNEAEDKYFAARSDDDTPQARRTFRAGYERAFQRLWNERAASNAELKPLPPPTNITESMLRFLDLACPCGKDPDDCAIHSDGGLGG